MKRIMLALVVVVLAGSTAFPQARPQSTPAEATYRLSPGDIIEIRVWGAEEYSGQFQLNENGKLVYPVLGEIDAQRLTLAQLRDTLRAGLGGLFVEPFVTITPRFRIAVLGEVRTPGLYTVDPTLSVLDVVALAGGATPVGNLGKIKVFRVGEDARMNFEQETLGGRSLQQIGIRSGDQVVVPRKFFTRQDLSTVLALLQIGLSIAIFMR